MGGVRHQRRTNGLKRCPRNSRRRRNGKAYLTTGTTAEIQDAERIYSLKDLTHDVNTESRRKMKRPHRNIELLDYHKADEGTSLA
jgi:hypothetical protein